MRPMTAELLVNDALYREVVLKRLANARESVRISTANVKEMLVEHRGDFQPVADLFATLVARRVSLKLLHAELPSRAFRASFDRRKSLVEGGLELKVCPRVHFKTVIVDGAWAYIGSANLTGAGLGAKGPDRRNFEVGFVTEDFDVIDRMSALFDGVWAGAECGTCRVRDVCPDPIGAPARRSRKRSESGPMRLGTTRRLNVLR